MHFHHVGHTARRPFAAYRIAWAQTLVIVLISSCCGAAIANDFLSDVDKRIEEHRKGSVEIKITLADGSELPAGTKVRAKLDRHEFLFGSNLFGFNNASGIDENKYRSLFAEVFNYATLPFYWQTYEPEVGKHQRDRWMEAAKWARDNDIRTKGHPLIWKLEPAWLAEYPDQEKKQLALNRVTNIVNEYKGLIDTWDVLNEPSWGKKDSNRENAAALSLLYDNGEAELLKQAHSLARQANPNATLIINDHDITGRFENIIVNALNAGTDFDAIGIQSHMHEGYWDPQQTRNTLDRFSKFDKPIHFSEVAILSGDIRKKSVLKKKINRLNEVFNSVFIDKWVDDGSPWESTEAGELNQATQVREYYKLLFSYPAVEAITWWDFSDRYAWKNAPAGLIDKNLNPKPAYYALHKLINESWSTDKRIPVAAEGISLHGFYGKYTLSARVNGKTYKGSINHARDGQQLVKAVLK